MLAGKLRWAQKRISLEIWRPWGSWAKRSNKKETKSSRNSLTWGRSKKTSRLWEKNSPLKEQKKHRRETKYFLPTTRSSGRRVEPITRIWLRSKRATSSTCNVWTRVYLTHSRCFSFQKLCSFMLVLSLSTIGPHSGHPLFTTLRKKILWAWLWGKSFLFQSDWVSVSASL